MQRVLREHENTTVRKRKQKQKSPPENARPTIASRACRPAMPVSPVSPPRSRVAPGALGTPGASRIPTMVSCDTPRALRPYCPYHFKNSVHISVHMNVDRNMGRLSDVMWTTKSVHSSVPTGGPGNTKKSWSKVHFSSFRRSAAKTRAK